jgi:hypothetical protein
MSLLSGSIPAACRAARVTLISTALTVSLAGCGRIAHSLYQDARDAKISQATKALQSATTNPLRAAAYADRGDAVTDRARYSRAFKFISGDDYRSLFEAGIRDLDRAISLDPGNAELYYRHGTLGQTWI